MPPSPYRTAATLLLLTAASTAAATENSFFEPLPLVLSASRLL